MKNILANNKFLIAVHFIFLVSIFTALKFAGIIKIDLSEISLLNFDAAWYNRIRTEGYLFSDTAQSSSGFYPLFPYLWKLLSVGGIGISIINGLLFIISILILNKHFDFSSRELLLFISIPSLIFSFVPYTESLFFLFSTLFLVGMKQNNTSLQLIGIFCCCLVRPVTIIFVPGMIFLELLSDNEVKKKAIRIILFSLAAIVPLFIVAYIQWLETGVWMAYYKAQLEHWDRSLHIPVFPLTTWGGPRIIWLDGTAFWLGLLSICFCFYFLLKRVSEKVIIENTFLFSITYLSAATLLVFLFDGYSDKGTTSVMGLNRYFYATPFFIIAFQKFLRIPQISSKNYVLLLISLMIVWLMFGAYTTVDWYNHTKTIIYFGILTLGIAAAILMLNHEWFLKRKAWLIIYLANSFLFIYLFHRFLNGQWVG